MAPDGITTLLEEVGTPPSQFEAVFQSFVAASFRHMTYCVSYAPISYSPIRLLPIKSVAGGTAPGVPELVPLSRQGDVSLKDRSVVGFIKLGPSLAVLEIFKPMQEVKDETEISEPPA